MQATLTDKAIVQFSALDINSEDDEEIEVIYVENLTGNEIVEFARYGEIQIIQELEKLDLLQKLKEATDSRGNTALHMASANGHLEVVTFLVKVFSGDTGYMNATNHEQNTALHWAALNGHKEVVEVLLKSGANHAVSLSLYIVCNHVD